MGGRGDDGWLERWITVRIDPVSPQHMHLFIQAFIPLKRTFTEHLLSTKSILNTADAGVIRKDRHHVYLSGIHSLEPKGEQEVRLHFHRKNAEGSFPVYISQ